MVGTFYNPVRTIFGWGSMNRLKVSIQASDDAHTSCSRRPGPMLRKAGVNPS